MVNPPRDTDRASYRLLDRSAQIILSVNLGVGCSGQKLLKLTGRDRYEQFGRALESGRCKPFDAEVALDSIQDIPECACKVVTVDSPAVIQAGCVANPLPELRPRNLGSGGVFHQVIDGYATVTAQPRLNVLQCHIDVAPESL